MLIHRPDCRIGPDELHYMTVTSPTKSAAVQEEFEIKDKEMRILGTGSAFCRPSLQMNYPTRLTDHYF